MSYIKGNFKKYIFKSDNNYVIGLLKVKDNSSDLDYKNKTVTFTGYFDDLNELDLYLLEGSIVNHDKYGQQFNVTSYEVVLPEEKDHIIDFLSSELFKGIGEKKATKIVDTLGPDCLNKILEEKDLLLTVQTVTKKQRDIIYDSLENYKSSYEKLMNLTKIGLSIKDALKIQKTYNEHIEEVFKNPYQMIEDLKEITFKKIERIRHNLDIKNDDLNRISASILYVMDELSFATGNTYLFYEEIIRYTKRLLNLNEEIITNGITNLIKENKILIDGNKYYKMTTYEQEKYIAERLSHLTKDYNPETHDKYISEIEKDFNCTFNKQQKQSIEKSISNKISVITGGPGTGKTTIIKAVTELYKKINKLETKDLVKELILLAPTGRASKRMIEKTNLPSYTIHRFLKWQKEENTFLINEENKSSARFIIIDEASMLDNELFYNLLLGLEPSCKILLIGDYNQLPSVGAGQILKDIIESDIIPVTYLKKLYRQDESSNINIFAHDIIDNKIDFELFNESTDLTFIECTKETLKDNLKDFLITYKDMSIYDIQVLAPIYKGDNGIDNLNIYIQDLLNKKNNRKTETIKDGVLYREEDKVLQLINSVDNNVFNGDIGQIIKINKSKTHDMIIDFDNNLVKYSPANYDNFKLGYTISIHKAQGSEFSIVIIPVLNTYGIMLYKKLIYTAVTRAKQRLIILGEKSALKKAILTDRDETRRTSLKEFLIESITS